MTFRLNNVQICLERDLRHIFSKVTCVYGSNERWGVQDGLKRIAGELPDARLSHICTRFRSLEANLHVIFEKTGRKFTRANIARRLADGKLVGGHESPRTDRPCRRWDVRGHRGGQTDR